MMCLGWKNTDSCSSGIDACSVLAIEGGAVLTDPTGSQCRRSNTPWGWILLGALVLFSGGRKGR